MAAIDNRSKIFVPFFPSLSHLASVKLSISLYNGYGMDALLIGIIKIHYNDPPPSFFEKSRTPIIRKLAHQHLLFIPVHLRDEVFRAIHSMERASLWWLRRNTGQLEIEDDALIFHFRSDGRIDDIKTAQQAVLNANIDIRTRFNLACKYCFEESIQNLWTEMELAGKTENLETNCHSMVNFWVKWIRDGASVPWKQAAREFFNDPQQFFLKSTLNCHLYTRFSFFLTSSDFDMREEVLLTLELAELNDFMACLQTLTKKEEDDILERCPLMLLKALIEWPYQSLFLQTIKRMFNRITVEEFCSFLDYFFILKERNEDFDYLELFDDLWKICPFPLREGVRRFRFTSERKNDWLNEIRKKRVAEMDNIKQMLKLDLGRSEQHNDVPNSLANVYTTLGDFTRAWILHLYKKIVQCRKSFTEIVYFCFQWMVN